MSDYQFLLRLEDVDPRSTQVRVWIDDQLSGDLSSEHEIELEREAGAWSARFSANGNAFIYRIGIFAAHGTRWSLCFRNVDEDEELLFDSDELAMPKEWLVGTCEDAFRTPRLLGHSSEVHIR
jgi:hypothetical protein